MNTYNMDKMYEIYAYTVERMQMWLDESEQENKQLKEHIEKYEHYCKTTGIEELMQENKKYKEIIDKAIEYLRSNYIEVLKYHDIPSETTSYEIVTVDLLEILKGVE